MNKQVFIKKHVICCRIKKRDLFTYLCLCIFYIVNFHFYYILAVRIGAVWNKNSDYSVTMFSALPFWFSPPLLTQQIYKVIFNGNFRVNTCFYKKIENIQHVCLYVSVYGLVFNFEVLLILKKNMLNLDF